MIVHDNQMSSYGHKVHRNKEHNSVYDNDRAVRNRLEKLVVSVTHQLGYSTGKRDVRTRFGLTPVSKMLKVGFDIFEGVPTHM